jgi:hypothetical protein
VDSHAKLAELRGCREVAGDLRIEGTNVTSLAALSALVRVSGQLDISDNRHLTTLKGLDRLARVGQLSLRNNPRLASVSALTRLNAVRSLVIEGAPALGDSSGLEGISDLDALTIQGTALSTLDGLSNVHAVGELTVIDNPNLISVRALRRIEEARSIVVRENPLLYGGSEEFFPRLIRAERVSISGNSSMSRSDVASFRRRVGGEAVTHATGEVHASR